MKQLEQAPHAPRSPMRSRIAGCAALLLLLAGCQRESEPAPVLSKGQPLERSLFVPVAAAQSAEEAEDLSQAKPLARTETEETGDKGNPGDTEKSPRQSEKGPEREEIEDKTSRDFTKRTCLASGCHAGLHESPRVHGPVAVGACHLCHEAEGQPNEHRFKATRSKEELCTLCHRPADPLAVVHEPYGKSECTGCHNPHGGSSTKFLRAETTAATCRLCHERRKATVAHKPVAEGDCLACHASHQARFKHLLALDGRELCLGCHVDLVKTFKESPHIHGPVVEDCTKCHLSHGSENIALLREEPQMLCLSCHEETANGAARAQSGHVFTTDSGAAARCSDCHRPHASRFEKLLIAPGGQVCFSCHDREIKRRSGQTIPSVRQSITSAKFVHEPVGKGQCGTCHFAHFSSQPALLKSQYPAAFYAEFSVAAYELCLSCHDRRLVLEERTSRTQFRDGDRNLHFVHVNRKKGRTCGVCHEPHASQQPALVRKTVPFGTGNWKLPIRFEKKTTGGTCASGCHPAYSYDNTSPPPAQKEGTLPESAAPGAPPTVGGNGE